MISLRHTGIYVDDIDRMEKFYTDAFEMIPICCKELDKGELFDKLLGVINVEIMTTKLITPYGKRQGQGDMIELVKLLTKLDLPSLPQDHPISMKGMSHVAFGVDDMSFSVDRILAGGGALKTDITTMKNKNLCCFCTDIEGNWIELIQRFKGESI